MIDTIIKAFTTVFKANNTSNSLAAIIPRIIVRALDLYRNDRLQWELGFDVIQNEKNESKVIRYAIVKKADLE